MSKLVANVAVDGVWYGPAYGNEADVPAEVAERVTNPSVWDKPPESVQVAEPAGPTGAPRGPSLADLDAISEDKEALVAFRDAHDLDVDGRLGVDKLRQALQDAIEG